MSRFFFIRHSLSTYQNMRNVIQGQNPEGQIDYQNQVYDVPPKGVELAEEKATEFLGQLDPEKDVIIFVSSNEARAIDTANVYRKLAKSMGFKMLHSYAGGCDYALVSGEGEIWVLDALCLNPKNVLLHSIYNSNPSKVFSIDWKIVREKTREAWNVARKIIESDDRGSWGANFAAHSKAVKEILKSVNPNEMSVEDLDQNNFRYFIRLVSTIRPNSCPNGVIMAFGHENYVLVALEKYFKEHGIGNCEAMSFIVSNGVVTAKFRGKEAIIR
jgi:hypothetical protein